MSCSCVLWVRSVCDVAGGKPGVRVGTSRDMIAFCSDVSGKEWLGTWCDGIHISR